MSPRVHRLERSQRIPRRREEVFAFFADASNLEAITPPFLRFRIVSPLPIEMGPGARIEYALSLGGVPLRWCTRIAEWEPGVLFVDEQESGPYRLWRHTHGFEDEGSATMMRDLVEYAEPLGALRGMEWVNYHHLLYFWLVAREGGLARACAELRLAQSTVSKQIHQFEDALGHPLFTKSGRRLVLTESGRVVFRYADEIFGLGREMLDTLKDRPVGRPITVTIGIADVLPKTVSERLLAPAFQLPEGVRMVCREGEPRRLLADLALHELDMVLADAPATPDVKVRGFNHLLGSSGVLFFASPELVRGSRAKFPAVLGDLPLLLPTGTSALRRRLDQWFDGLGLRPQVVAEFEDSALLEAFGVRGVGAFPAATLVGREIMRHHGLRPIGEVPGVTESYYAVTVERRIKHPAVMAICERARGVLSGRT